MYCDRRQETWAGVLSVTQRVKNQEQQKAKEQSLACALVAFFLSLAHPLLT
jgi:hypothetical protein